MKNIKDKIKCKNRIVNGEYIGVQIDGFLFRSIKSYRFIKKYWNNEMKKIRRMVLLQDYEERIERL